MTEPKGICAVVSELKNLESSFRPRRTESCGVRVLEWLARVLQTVVCVREELPAERDSVIFYVSQGWSGVQGDGRAAGNLRDLTLRPKNSKQNSLYKSEVAVEQSHCRRNDQAASAYPSEDATSFADYVYMWLPRSARPQVSMNPGGFWAGGTASGYLTAGRMLSACSRSERICFHRVTYFGRGFCSRSCYRLARSHSDLLARCAPSPPATCYRYGRGGA